MFENHKEDYSIHFVSDDNGDFFYCIYENTTEQVINFFYFEDDALAYKSFLEAGGGFSGFTPSFILKSVALPINKHLLNLNFKDSFFAVK